MKGKGAHIMGAPSLLLCSLPEMPQQECDLESLIAAVAFLSDWEMGEPHGYLIFSRDGRIPNDHIRI